MFATHGSGPLYYLAAGQDGGECCGKAIGEVDPSILGKTTSLK